MKCHNCGKEVENHARFCTKCGAPLYQENNMQQDTYIISENSESEKKRQIQNNKKLKWKDSYTIIAIIIVMVIAALIGSFVKNYVGKNETKYNTENRNNKSYKKNISTSSSNKVSTQYEDKNNRSTEDYILEGSNYRYISKSELETLTKSELRLARNEIYARHGRKFDDYELQNYFSSFEWYIPEIAPDDFDESILNKYELANRDLILNYEREKGYK